MKFNFRILTEIFQVILMIITQAEVSEIEIRSILIIVIRKERFKGMELHMSSAVLIIFLITFVIFKFNW